MLEQCQGQRSDQVMPATVNRNPTLLKPLLTKVVVWPYLKRNPAKPVKRLKEEALLPQCPVEGRH